MSGFSQIEVRFSTPPCTWLALTLTGENGVACRTHKPNPNRDQLSRCPTYSHLKKFLVISHNVATITWIWIWSSYFRIAAPSFLTSVSAGSLGCDAHWGCWRRWPSRQRSRRSDCGRGDRGWCAGTPPPPSIAGPPGRRRRRRPPDRCRKRSGSRGTS